jgi:hypothetical protein
MGAAFQRDAPGPWLCSALRKFRVGFRSRLQRPACRRFFAVTGSIFTPNPRAPRPTDARRPRAAPLNRRATRPPVAAIRLSWFAGLSGMRAR